MPQLFTKPNGKYSNGKPRFRPDPKKYLYNIDTFWYNCRAIDFGYIMDAGLRDELIAGREYYFEHGEHLRKKIKIDAYKNPLEFKIMDGGRGPMYQYSLRNDSMAIYFRKNEHENGALIRVQINQFILWEKGFIGAYNESLAILEELGLIAVNKSINRCDFAVHSDQWRWNLNDMKKLEYPVNIAGDNFPNFIRLDPMSGNFETYYHGDRSRLFIRIYDKSKEIKDNEKFYFNEIYKKHDMDIENVWNLEIEVRRNYLKDLQEYNSADDDFKRIFDDLDYCLETDGLSRLWSHVINRYHHPSAHWTQLQLGDGDKFENINEYNLSMEKDIKANYEREKNQIAGRMMIGVVNEEDYSLENALKIFEETYLGDDPSKAREEWLEKVEKKKSAINNHEINRTIRKDSMRFQLAMEAYRKSELYEGGNSNQRTYIQMENKKARNANERKADL